jgi:hypothetical protein
MNNALAEVTLAVISRGQFQGTRGKPVGSGQETNGSGTVSGVTRGSPLSTDASASFRQVEVGSRRSVMDRIPLGFISALLCTIFSSSSVRDPVYADASSGTRPRLIVTIYQSLHVLLDRKGDKDRRSVVQGLVLIDVHKDGSKFLC